MEFDQLFVVLFQLLVWNAGTWNFPTTAAVATAPPEDTSNGIWALSSRYNGIYLTNRDITEVNQWKTIEFASTDVTYDPKNGLLLFCIPADDDPYDCMLHRTSLDQCYDEHFATISMENVYGMEVDSVSRLLYVSSIDVPGICEVNIDTGERHTYYEDEEQVNYLRISPDKRYLYWTQLFDDAANTVRRGNIDGTGTPITILSRPSLMMGFGIDFSENRIYFTQATTIYSTDIDGNDEQTIITETSSVWEMTVDDKYLYWGNGGDEFRRLSLAGDPGSNTIETLTTITTANRNIINHHLITRDELDLSRSVLSLSSSTYRANEADQSLTIDVTRTGNLLRCSCVDVVAIPGARRLTRATIQNTLNFAAHDVTQSLTLTWTDDLEPNGPDQVSISLIVNSDDTVGAVDEATFLINDDDCGYSFVDADITVNEDVSFVDARIRRTCTGDMSGAFSETIHVVAEELDGSAQAGFDFASGLIQASFAQGQDTATLRVPLFDNNQPEETEQFVLRLSDPENGRLLDPNSEVITIVDYDNLYVIEQNQYEVMESDRVLEIPIRRIGNLTLPGSVRVAARGQTAEFLIDFEIDSNAEIINFPSGVSEIIASILIIDDDVLESNETLEIVLLSAMGGHLDDRKEASIIIIDNEAEITMSDSRYSCLESNPCVVNVVRRGFLDQTTASYFRTEDFSAFAGIDFVALDRLLTFDPWVTSLDVQISLIDDDVKEPNANFIVLVNNVTNGLAGDPNRASVALWDDDSQLPMLVYTLEPISHSVRESDEQIQFLVLRGGSYLGQAGSVRLQVLKASDGSPAGQDDIVDPDVIVEFEESQREQVINIHIINDDIIETTEEFVVQLSDAVNGVIGDESRATVTIQDEDASYYLDSSLYNVSENSGGLTVLVHRFGYDQETGYVTLQVVSGNATYGSDYILSPIGISLQFNPGQTTKSTFIQIIDDDEAEQSEIIDIVLSKPKYGALGNPSSAVIVIYDDDMMIEAKTTPVPQRGQQVGTTAIALIISAIIVLLIITIIGCTFCTCLLYQKHPLSAVFPRYQPQYPVQSYPSSPSHKVPQTSPYADFGHIVRRFSGRAVRHLSDRFYKNPYGNTRRSPAFSPNALVLYRTTNPTFQGDSYYSNYRSVFDKPGIRSNRIALPPTPSPSYPY